MMKATKIRMQQGCMNSNSLLEIDKIYLVGCQKEGYYEKENLYDYLKKYPKTIQVNIVPYPYLEPVISANGEKYVRSEGNSIERDNLLRLPRE